MRYKNNQERILTNIEINKETQCWNWQKCKNDKGYGWIGLSGTKILAHRYSYQVFVGEISDGLCVLHKCDNPACVNPDHLFLGTLKDNAVDKVNKGRAYTGCHQGELHPSCKLKTSQVIEIRNLYKSGNFTQKELANKYSLSQSHVADIINKRKWGHIC